MNYDFLNLAPKRNCKKVGEGEVGVECTVDCPITRTNTVSGDFLKEVVCSCISTFVSSCLLYP